MPSDAITLAAHQQPRAAGRSRAFALEAGDAQDLVGLAHGWPRGRLLSNRLAAWHCGGLPALFQALSTPGYLLGGACLRDDTATLLGWMVLVRHHERQGYAGTARLIFDLDPLAPAEGVRTLFHACLGAPGAARLRVAIGFSDEHSPTIAQGFTALGFASAGTLALGPAGTASTASTFQLQAHAWEAQA